MAKGKKSSLKSALVSQQTRLKKKQEVAEAAKLTEQKSKSKRNPRDKGKGKAQPLPTIPFKATDKLLLIGEGNFSFARALVVNPPDALQFLPPENITATAYDSREECFSKYPDAAQIVEQLSAKGVKIVFGVDATKLENCSVLKNRRFDKIVWNFPHAGKGITDQDRNILSNQVLLLGFLQSASNLLNLGPKPNATRSKKKKARGSDDEDDSGTDNGEGMSQTASSRGTILITLRNVPPYTLWDLPQLAKSPPPSKSPNIPRNPFYTQLRSFVFHREIWKGYEHRMTKGERAHGQGTTGVGGEDRTWEFYLRD
ncbi:hypothetical protein NLI96_g6632 [Meripilus lineatus]|uniref:25S rRNA (uridine-N(3))-methyltransferase BMT5-like domain-containing protein n=1 Tax=Meripilus lineatus TaxID=2056292 RepID=A0AAD5V309_9APHY|nr:hypothetical protein NLI96_g6632 [Physisporinus lineatus]